jgi:capsular polysaccharide transport system permease protein
VTKAMPAERVLSLEEHKSLTTKPVPEDDAPAKAAPKPEVTPVPVAQPARAARVRPRHWGILVSFLLLVVTPTLLGAWYLWERAVDRYVSVAAFSVRAEEMSSPFELLGGLAMGSSSSSDTDILYDFIQSQEIVVRINEQVDLRALWAKANPAVDPVFAYHPPGTIEDMVIYWNRVVKVYNDPLTGLVRLEVQAFTPEDAHLIATLVYEESSRMINRLSAIAQEDATRFSRQELEEAVERLKEAREAVTLFRNRYQLVDPAASMQSQMGILSSLEQELAATLIDLDILRQTTSGNDPRIVQAERRIEVIEERIRQERNKLGIGMLLPGQEAQTNGTGNAFANLIGEYERLMVDQQFAEQFYAMARSTYDAAVSESRRQSRYLAAHVQPTLAERALQPERITLLALLALFTFLSWSMLTLAFYALKDRR